MTTIIDMKKQLATIQPKSEAKQAQPASDFNLADVIGETAACVVSTVTDVAPAVGGFFERIGVRYQFTRAVHQGILPDPSATPKAARTRR